ncbi:hypothetical protein PP16_gp04 [Pectobacterium phage PP16]|uniref:Uncharacterized protein n=1 Tax=Pectobacterium phage PP16 TaxID=1873958 RepID=A0A1B1PEF1_9CAUD|nr:hypothetical protein PP16_gp04 [Pectobacterium phage PP16]ANT45353.1 hypothetical protein PP16_gp04 [Pectobacterium phage PP16]
MMTRKTFHRTLVSMCLYGAGKQTLFKYCRATKVKHVPARYKKRIASKVCRQIKDMTFGLRYGRHVESDNLFLS